ncbi:MAG: hypothetical protein KAI66_26950 [Lentisphaeria bacterium]|nr:hypothetical protein [Lentisphaeria bacterium]
MAKEIVKTAKRKDLSETLIELATQRLPDWREEFDAGRKGFEQFVRMRLSDLLILHLLEVEDRESTAVVAYLLHAEDIRRMASTLVKQHKLTWMDAEDFDHSGRMVVAELMKKFSPLINDSFHGFAFGRIGLPSFVFRGLQQALYGFLHVTEDQYRKAKQLRKALDAFRLLHGRDPLEREVADALGIVRLTTVRRHWQLKEICFDGLTQPMAERQYNDGGVVDAEGMGMFGEAEAYWAEGRKTALHSDVRRALRRLVVVNSSQAVALAHACGFSLTDMAKTLLVSMSDAARRQNVCRGKATLRTLFMETAAA